MAFNQRILSVIKNLGLRYLSLLVFISIFFASIILTIPESAITERVVISLIGSTCFFLLVNIILSNQNENVIALQRVNQEIKTKLDGSSINLKKSNINSIFTNITNINYKNKNFISLIIGAVFGITLFSFSTSHYLFYMVDNSGSMGLCPNWTEKEKCPKPLPSPEEVTVTYVTEHLTKLFEDDKSLGSTEVSESSLPILPFYKFTPDVKVGLIEIGGKASVSEECIVKEWAEPVLNNQKELVNGIKKIEANSNGTTALITALKKADSSINLRTPKPLRYAASKNVILFTDTYEDNCDGSTRNFCEATSELPEGFNIKLNIYAIRDTNISQENADKKFSCDKFKCGEKYSVENCKEISVDEIKQGSIPKLGMKLDLSPTLTTTSYTSLALSLICITSIFGTILKYREELWDSYPKQIYLFIDNSTRNGKMAINHIIRFLGQEENIPRFVLLIIFVVFVIMGTNLRRKNQTQWGL